MKPTFDLGWGDTPVVRQALVETLDGMEYAVERSELSDMGYPPHAGMPALVELCKDLAKRQSGRRPEHLYITCGATGAINAALYAMDSAEYVECHTRYFPFYPKIIDLAGKQMVDQAERNRMVKAGAESHRFITLVDSPSNPEGLIYPNSVAHVWDAAYAGTHYGGKGASPVSWGIMCGSLSKTLGINGCRLGWAATDRLYESARLGAYVTASSSGMSVDSQLTAIGVLKRLDIDRFESRAKGYIDDNRAQAQRVLDKFGQGDAPARGMYFLVQLGKSERRALERARVKWQPGPSWGADDSWARLSLGQKRETVLAAVNAIIK